METVWRFRIMLVMAFTIIIFGDLLGYGNVNGDKTSSGQQSQANAAALKNSHRSKIDLTDATSVNEIEAMLTKKSNPKLLQLDIKDKIFLANNLREACLPKMLCEIAAKPTGMISDKESSLLELIRSTTLSLVWHHATPTRWHFAAHMGQLMRDSFDSLGGPSGCAELWPQCPFSTEVLLKLSKKKTL